MKKNIKKIIFIGTSAILVLFVALFIFTEINFSNTEDNCKYENVNIIGEYSTDGKKWSKTQTFDDFDDKDCETLYIRGKLSKPVPKNQWLIVSMCNVWVEMKINNKTVVNNMYSENLQTDTPGNSIQYVSSDDIPENSEIYFMFKNPYTVFKGMHSVKNTLERLIIGDKSAPYNFLLRNNLLAIILSLSICFLGLFAFSLAGFLWKKVMLKNLALSFLAVIGGIYALSDSIYPYLPLFIDNPVLCMVSDEFTSYLLPIAAFIYVRANLENKDSKTFLSSLLIISILLSCVCVFLQIFGVMDILKSQVFFFPFVILGTVGCIVCLMYEAFRLKSNNSKVVLISLCPLIAASLIDAINAVVGFTSERLFIRIGLLLTILIQLYLLFSETKKHQKEVLQFEKMQKEMLQMKVSIMVSQIQPHFLYNSLTSIAQLCEKNPAKAKKATIEFSEYLRSNMNSLKEQTPVPFDKELKHLQTYLSLEKMRFGDELNIRYDIQTTDFQIPSLTVQPLVENAVKHGVGMLEDGGTVTVSTREYDDKYEVIVSDNGVGFDVTKKPKDGRTHVGMENVKNRLKTMCNAKLEIESQIGVGTKATITIPKEND